MHIGLSSHNVLQYHNVTDGQTDRQTDTDLLKQCMLCTLTRDKNEKQGNRKQKKNVEENRFKQI